LIFPGRQGTILPISRGDCDRSTRPKLSRKELITISKRLDDAYRREPGQAFVVIDTGEGMLLRPSWPFAPANLDDVAGSLLTNGLARTIEEMEEGLQRAV
jgi:hypothetical protein